MTTSGYQLAPEQGRDGLNEEPFKYLLHALNQPLTALQCSLELSALRPNHTDRDLQTFQEALELTSRMRVLVEALREIADTPSGEIQEFQTFPFDSLLRDVIADLLPLAESKRIQIRTLGDVEFAIRANRCLMSAALFRFLEAALALTVKRAELKILGLPHDGEACLVVSWITPEGTSKAFSRAELALLTAQFGLRRIGAVCNENRSANTCTCTLRLPLAVTARNPRDGVSK